MVEIVSYMFHAAKKKIEHFLINIPGSPGMPNVTFNNNFIVTLTDVGTGSITLDGVDVREVSKQDLRAQVAIVSQESVLFSDTIANNIQIGKADATFEEIKQAARMAHAHEFIESFEDGYETIVGERGSRLSGGQRQRIAIARAFLKNAPIIRENQRIERESIAKNLSKYAYCNEYVPARDSCINLSLFASI